MSKSTEVAVMRTVPAADRDVEESTAMPAIASTDRTLDLDESTVDERIVSEPRKGAMPTATRPTRTIDRPAAKRVAVGRAPVRPGFTHTSLAAAMSLFLGTAGLAAAFSGSLAPVGVLLGSLAVIFAGFGLVMAGRDRVTGHGVAVAGLLLGLGAVSVAALVMAGDLSWLHSGSDGAGRAREWLNEHFSWMKNW